MKHHMRKENRDKKKGEKEPGKRKGDKNQTKKRGKCNKN
jgi:hypothetical protein